VPPRGGQGEVVTTTAEHKVVLITGANKGIGFATAGELAAPGTRSCSAPGIRTAAPRPPATWPSSGSMCGSSAST